VERQTEPHDSRNERTHQNFQRFTGPDERACDEARPGGIGHACEFETSLLLHLRPDLVRSHKIAAGTNQPTFAWAESDMLRGSPARLHRSFSQMTTNGVFGDPRSASAAKGKAILGAVVAAIAPIIADLSKP